jgi:hypothetical protein
MRASVAQGFGTIGQQVAERHEILASSRRATLFPILRRTIGTRRTKRLVKAGADQDLSTRLNTGAVAAPGSGSVAPRGSGQPVNLASRRVYSRTAERYWILRSGHDELRFTHRSGAERWATKLAERGLLSELTWHDESIEPATQGERDIA